VITLPVVPGSPDWLEARRCRPTASRFGEIIQPKKLQYSTSAAKYRAELLAEWVSGYPIERPSSQAMERGTDMEAEAIRWYELQRDVDVEPGSFVLRDDERVGGTPDGFVGEAGLLEIKCPLLQTHILYALDPGALEDAYRAQVQGYLGLTGREWADLVSYSPTLPKVVRRIERDEAFQTALTAALDRFLEELDAGKERLLAMGVQPAPSFLRQADPAAWATPEAA
jgi:hypothetical protein